MNFSPFAGHFAGAIPAIHQFATGALVSNSSSAADNRYAAPPSHQHPGAAAGASSAASGSGGGGGGGSGHMNKYAGHQSQQSQQPQLHYGTSAQSQYAAEVAENGQKHHRGSGLGGAMTNGYHQGQGGSAGEQNQEHGQLSGHDSKRLLQNSTPSSWQAPSSTVADYLSHLPASTLPLSLHHFLKYSAETIKKESNSLLPNGDVQQQQQHQHHQLSQHESNLNHQQQIDGTNGGAPGKKKKKKKASKAQKEKKPRPKPGEIRLTTALDGSTLFCCPECQMAYPERGLLEQHLVGHNLERRFICDICNAALKRKDHLTRHKQSHNPERPFVCTICMKAFKRKEQLTLHFVIHSGEKRHICPECGKGFYRKDHLRKHTRSHIARRVKAELSQGPSASSSSGPANGGQSNGSAASLVVPSVVHHQMQQQQAMGR